MTDGVPAADFSAADYAALDRDGYLTLPGAVPADWLAPLRDAFEAGVVPSDQWPVARGQDWRHAMVDHDPLVRQLCRLPALIAAVRHMLGQPFFLAQVEGRDPRQGNRPQPLHRDGAGMAGHIAAAMVWLDPYNAANGATRVVPGSHRQDTAAEAEASPKSGATSGAESGPESAALLLSGKAGDILTFAPDLLHGATTNHNATPRRALLLTYAAVALRDQFAQTAALRGVGMGYGEVLG